MKIFLVLFLLVAADAFGGCNHTLTGASITYTFGETNPTISRSVSLKKTGTGGTCSTYFIGFDTGSGSSYSRRVRNSALNTTIDYNLYKANNLSGILKDKGDINSNAETLFGNIPNNTIETQNFYFALAPVNATTPPRFGTYTDSIKVSSYSGTWTSPDAQEDNFNLIVTVTVPKMIYLSMITSGGAFDSTQTSKILDFGELGQNEELGFDIKLVSNAGYNLRVSSANNGKLKNTVESGTDALIDYTFTANGNIRSLSSSSSSPVSIATGTGLTPAGGATVPIKVKIGDVTNKSGGDYEDVITVTVVSTD